MVARQPVAQHRAPQRVARTAGPRLRPGAVDDHRRLQTARASVAGLPVHSHRIAELLSALEPTAGKAELATRHALLDDALGLRRVAESKGVVPALEVAQRAALFVIGPLRPEMRDRVAQLVKRHIPARRVRTQPLQVLTQSAQCLAHRGRVPVAAHEIRVRVQQPLPHPHRQAVRCLRCRAQATARQRGHRTLVALGPQHRESIGRRQPGTDQQHRCVASDRRHARQVQGLADPAGMRLQRRQLRRHRHRVPARCQHQFIGLQRQALFEFHAQRTGTRQHASDAVAHMLDHRAAGVGLRVPGQFGRHVATEICAARVNRAVRIRALRVADQGAVLLQPLQKMQRRVQVHRVDARRAVQAQVGMLGAVGQARAELGARLHQLDTQRLRRVARQVQRGRSPGVAAAGDDPALHAATGVRGSPDWPVLPTLIQA